MKNQSSDIDFEQIKKHYPRAYKLWEKKNNDLYEFFNSKNIFVTIMTKEKENHKEITAVVKHEITETIKAESRDEAIIKAFNKAFDILEAKITVTGYGR